MKKLAEFLNPKESPRPKVKVKKKVVKKKPAKKKVAGKGKPLPIGTQI